MLHCSVRTTGGRRMPPSGLLEGLTLFAENTGLFQPGHRCGGSILGGGNDSTSFCNTVHYGTTGSATRDIELAPY